MPQNIQLQKVMVNLMVVKVGGNNGTFRIIGRMLYRCKGIDILSVGKHHNTAGMLSGGSSDSGDSRYQTIQLRSSLLFSPLFIKFLNHTIGGFFSQSTDSSRLVGIFLSKNGSGIGMGSGLIFSGEV